jgi:hypothetical protein
MFSPWAPVFYADGERGHCCAEQVPLRDGRQSTHALVEAGDPPVVRGRQ